MFPIFNPELKNEELLISEFEYHQRKDLVHQSSLKNMIKSPNAYFRGLKFPKKETPSLKFGSLAHKAILEGRDFLENYIVEPIFRGFTKDGVETTSANALSVKQAKAEWYATLRQNQKVVTQSEFDELGFMMESLVNHKFVQEIFKEGRPEVRGQFLDEKTGIGVAFANDFISFDLDTWVDLKTCQDSSHDDFRKSVERFRYDLQLAVYLKGTEKVFNKRPKTPVWIAIESSEPYETRVHFCDQFYIESGEYEYRKSMDNLADCLKSNEWPQGQSLIESLDPSPWFRSHYELRMEHLNG